MTELHDHPRGAEWSHPMEGWLQRIQWGFVVGSWLIAAAISLAVTTAVAMIFVASEGSVSTTDSGVVHIIAVGVTLLTFYLVMFIRLQRIDGDRLLNSLGVGALHAMAALMAGLIGMALRSNDVVSLPVSGSVADDLGLVFLAADRSAAAAILGCAIAAAIMPARGPLPTDTQTDELPTDRQL